MDKKTKQGNLRLALIGTDTLRGKEIKDILNNKPFPMDHIQFFDPDVEGEYSKLTEFRGEPQIIAPLETDCLEGADLVFLASDPQINRRYGKMAAKLGFRAIDLSEAYVADPKVPKVVFGINDREVLKDRPRVVSNPHPASILLAHLLQVVGNKGGVRRAVAVVLQPASTFGEAGIQELADQSYGMLQNGAVRKSVFKAQIAFNPLSQIIPVDERGFSAVELQIVQEVRKALARTRLPLSVSLIQVPVFHAYYLMLFLELKTDRTIRELAAFLRESPFMFYSAPSLSSPVSSVAAAGQDKILVGQLKQDRSLPRCFWLSAAIDNLTRGSALNAYDLALSMAAS